MGRKSSNAAVPRAAATTSPAPPAAPPVAASQGTATEATASSNGASEIATGAGDNAPAGGGQADLSEASFAAAHQTLREAMAESGEPLFMGVDLSSGPDRTAMAIQTPDAVFYFDDLHAVLDLGDGQVLTLGEFFDLPRDQQADLIVMLVDAAARAEHPVGLSAEWQGLPTSDELLDDLKAIKGPAPEGMVWVQAKSRDGKPFRRRGFAWDGNFQTQLVTEADAFVIANDPHLIARI